MANAKGVVKVDPSQVPNLSSGVYIMSNKSGIIKLDSVTPSKALSLKKVSTSTTAKPLATSSSTPSSFTPQSGIASSTPQSGVIMVNREPVHSTPKSGIMRRPGAPTRGRPVGRPPTRNLTSTRGSMPNPNTR